MASPRRRAHRGLSRNARALTRAKQLGGEIKYLSQPRGDIDPVYFDTPYYLYPDGPIAVAVRFPPNLSAL